MYSYIIEYKEIFTKSYILSYIATLMKTSQRCMFSI